MPNLGRRQLLAVLLCFLMSTPLPMASTLAATSGIVGSIENRGPVEVGDVRMPSIGTLFAGDRVATNSGVAVIQYMNGAQLILASESCATFARARVQLETGLMTFHSALMHGVGFSASTIRMEPTSPTVSGNIAFKENKISVVVTQGTLQITNASGVELALMKGGEARLFEVPTIGNLLQPVHARDANNSVEALEMLLAAAQARAAVLLRDAKGLSFYTEGATAASEVATRLEELETLQRQLASEVGTSAHAVSKLNAIITTLNSANASLRPCETPAAERAASPSRVFRSCH